MSRRRKIVAKHPCLRVGFVTPGLGVGGAERWVVSLAKHLSPTVQVSGILSYCITDPLSPEAAKVCPLFGPHQGAELAGRSDTIIAWGWEGLRHTFNGFTGRMVGVSHASPVQGWHCRVCAEMEKFPGIELVGVSKRSLDVWTIPHSGVYIPNGAELDRCSPRLGRKRVRRQLGIPDDAKVALFFSRLAPEKRPNLFVEAVLSRPGWVGILAGSDIQGMSKSLPVDPRIVLLPATDRPGDLLAASDVFVLPSTSEAHPLALTEAWLSGVPTIYCNWPFASQVREDHGSDLGTVVPIDVTADQLGDALEISRGGSSVSSAAYAREVSWECYTASAMASRWEDYLGVSPVESPSRPIYSPHHDRLSY